MIKNLLRELVLPSFWLFFFIASNHNEKNTGDGQAHAGHSIKENRVIEAGHIDKNNDGGLIKVIYLPQFNR